MALGCEKTDCGMGGKLGSNRSWRAEDNNRLTKEFTKRRRRNDYKKETREELNSYFEDMEDSQMQNEELITFEFAVNEYGKSDQLADHDTVKILFAPKGYSIRYKWCEDTHEN